MQRPPVYYDKLLYSKLAMHCSNQKFFAGHRVQGLRINEKVFWRRWRKHCDWAGVKSFSGGSTVSAACVTAGPYFYRLLSFYNKQHLWTLDPTADTVLIPTVLDGRNIWGKNELIACHFRECYSEHSPAHCHALCVSKFNAKESYAALQRMETQLKWGRNACSFCFRGLFSVDLFQ